MIRNLIILSLFALTACQGQSKQAEDDAPATELSYTEQVILARQEKLEYFKADKSSPIALFKDKSSIELAYYPVAEAYKVTAFLTIFDEQDTIEILTSKKNELRKVLRHGQLKFKLNGTSQRLIAYLGLEEGSSAEYLFVPFADATNSLTTYGAGRYLDVAKKAGRRYTLDFNLAYNPYCHYNPAYSCPLVPQDNVLRVEVKAGEKQARVLPKENG